jgi:hypothetical protein
MSVEYAGTLQTKRLQDVVSAIDAAASAGTLVIGTASMAAVLVTFALSKPSFAVAGNVMTMLGTPKTATAAVSGTAANAEIKDGAGNIVVSDLTVGVGGSDINFNSVAFSSGQTITLSSASITHS